MGQIRSWVCWVFVVLVPLEAVALAGRHLCERGHALAAAPHVIALAPAGSDDEGCPHAKALEGSNHSAHHATTGAVTQGTDAAHPTPGDARHASCDACSACVLLSILPRESMTLHPVSNAVPPSDDLRFSSAWLALIDPPPRA